ncbi:MAG: NDP-sugar synthase [Thermodesulfobacteriota bacterium]
MSAQTIEQAMILAAGQGVRAVPLSLVRPKPLFPLLNQPLIGHVLDLLAHHGITEVAINLHHLADKLEAYLARLETPVKIRTLREPEILGTGGGVKNAEAFLKDGPFILINSDVKIDLDLSQVVRDHMAHRPMATLVLHDYPRFNQVAVDPAGWIVGFRGKMSGALATGRSLAWRRLAFTGVHVVEPEVLSWLPPGRSDIIAAYQRIVGEGGLIRAYVADELAWWDAGTLKDYLRLHADLLSSRTDNLVADPSASISPGARVNGWACLGPGAVVEDGAVVENSILWPGASVKAGVRVRDSVLTDGARAKSDIISGAVI